MVKPNLLIDALDSLRACTTPDQIWTTGSALLAACGSPWISVGTAPRGTPDAVAARSSTPDSVMQDYVGERIHLQDPWMRHCARSNAIAVCDLRGSGSARDPQVANRHARLFTDHGILLANLLPVYGGSRPGGLVVYGCSADAADWLSRPEGRQDSLLLAAILAAHYRPEDDPSASDQLYRLHATLTPREVEALSWLANGHRIARIAERMGIEAVTVNKHLHAARQKLGARTREQALAIAVRDRLVTP